MSVEMSSISCSTRDCNQYNVSTTKVSVRYKTVLYLMKTFVVKTLYYCNLLCYVKYLTSLLIFEAVAMSLYHIIRSNLIDNPSKVLLPQNSSQQWMLLAIHSQWVMRVAIRDFQISFQIYVNAIYVRISVRD